MTVLLQPSSGKEAEAHFKDTIECGVLLESIKDRISETDLSKLKELNQENVKVWGFVPTIKEGIRTEWEKLGEDDFVLFYAKKRFFYIEKKGSFYPLYH